MEKFWQRRKSFTKFTYIAFLFIFGVILILKGFTSEDSAEQVINYGFGIFLIILSNLSQIKSLSFMGLKLSGTIQKAENTINQAEEIITKIKSLSLLLIKPASMSMAITSTKLNDTNLFLDESTKWMKEIGFNESIINETLSRYFQISMYAIILESGEKMLKNFRDIIHNENYPPEEYQILSTNLENLKISILKKFDKIENISMDTPDDIFKMIEDSKLLSTTQLEIVKNSSWFKHMKHFQQTKKFSQDWYKEL